MEEKAERKVSFTLGQKVVAHDQLIRAHLDFLEVSVLSEAWAQFPRPLTAMARRDEMRSREPYNRVSKEYKVWVPMSLREAGSWFPVDDRHHPISRRSFPTEGIVVQELTIHDGVVRNNLDIHDGVVRNNLDNGTSWHSLAHKQAVLIATGLRQKPILCVPSMLTTPAGTSLTT